MVHVVRQVDKMEEEEGEREWGKGGRVRQGGGGGGES